MSELVLVDNLTVLGANGQELAGPTTFRIPAGAVTALTGPSGSGKTTVMRALLGQLPSAARATGSASVAGHDVLTLHQDALRRFRRQHIAYVGQDPGSALNPLLRVRSLLREVAPDASKSALTDTLALVGLSPDYLHRRPGELSGGQQRRVALARALIRRTGVLVLDEPLAGLHGALRTDIAARLAELARERSAAILLSGHDTALVHSIADDVVELGTVHPTSVPLAEAQRIATPTKAFGAIAQSVHRTAGAAPAALLERVEADGGHAQAVSMPVSDDDGVGSGSAPVRDGRGDSRPDRVEADGGHAQAASMPVSDDDGVGSGSAPVRDGRGDSRPDRVEADGDYAQAASMPVSDDDGARSGSAPVHDGRGDSSPDRAGAMDVRERSDATRNGEHSDHAVVLRAQGIGASVDGHQVLAGIDLTLDTGAALAVVGASGAGKTTLARVIAGLHPCATGSLELRGNQIATGARRRRRYGAGGIQLVTQNPRSALNPRRTVAQTLGRPLRRIGRVPRRDIPQRVAELLASVELPADSAARYPHELSGGQRQRVALARALAAEPAVLLCDEITSALDHATAAAIMALLDRIRAERDTALLIITHDMSLVAEYCPRLLVLDHGRIVESGHTRTVLAAPTHTATSELLV
ncbi:ATP-binding cassette domain-containing protein [Nocardia gipuzkoensis]|uniref:ABC transporter ATP-binding protein n=1 Tax=Nocardia gipuzkoensis TaxID=2749991 RepID=UPI003EE3A1D7